MAVVNRFNWNVSGDIGGLGVSRFWLQDASHVQFDSTECDAAGAIIADFFSALRANYPSPVLWAPENGIEAFDVATAAPIGITSYGSVPAGHYGESSANWAAGIGARINLHTGAVVNRRFLRGAQMFVPMGSDSFDDTDGSVSSTTVTNIEAAWNTMADALVAINLALVVWHRPPKTDPGTGVAFQALASSVPSTPAGLRSRRS